MTLDEAIKHCEEVAEEHTKYNRYGGFESCDECAKEHRQLANWLKELKQLREQEPCGDCISRKALLEEIENGIKAGNYEEGYEEYPHINDMDDIIECIKYADSAQPTPKTDVLDKIRAEIEQFAKNPDFGDML